MFFEGLITKTRTSKQPQQQQQQQQQRTIKLWNSVKYRAVIKSGKENRSHTETGQKTEKNRVSIKNFFAKNEWP